MNCIFERDFDAEAAGAPPGRAPAPEAAAREAARAEGFAAGLAAGREAARDEARGAEARELRDLLGALARGIGALEAGAAAHRAAMERQALDFVRAAGERLAPELVASLGGARAAAEVRRCLALVAGSSRIEVALSPGALERHGAALEEAPGAEGRVRLRGDPGLGNGDARVRWEDGEMTYSMDDALGGLLEALRAHRAAPAAPAPEGTTHG